MAKSIDCILEGERFPLAEEPENEKLLRVGMHDFGYLRRNTPWEWLETYGIHTCRGFYLKGNGLNVLAHFPPGGNWLMVNGMLKYLKEKNMLKKKFDHATIIISKQLANEVLDPDELVPPILSKVCRKIRVVQYPFEEDAQLLINRKGEMYWLTGEIQKRVHYDSGNYRSSEGEIVDGVCGNNGDRIYMTEEEFTLPNRRSLSSVVRSSLR
jgi:hypothetical protein